MKHMTKLLAALLIAIALMLPLASAETGGVEYVVMPEETFELTETAEASMSCDEALEGYFTGLLGLNAARGLSVPRFVGGDLTGQNRLAYDALAVYVREVAAGERASTAFRLTPEQLGLSGKYTAADLGVTALFDENKKFTEEAKAAMRAKWAEGFVLSPVWRSLLMDHPYEMYWFDKTKGVNLTSSFGLMGTINSNHANDVAYFNPSTTHKTISFTVAAEFATDTYVFNTAMAQAAQDAAQNAVKIVARYAQDSDYEKLLGYKNTVCELAVYNTVASENNGTVAYGNPWQAIWVFDDDESTKVTCEGYSKAFQYLCDMTDFDDDRICCYTFIGEMNGGGHMWNIVRMPTGKNYLADITNCDTGTVGYPDKLFLAGSANGNANDGYIIALKSNMSYTYDEKTTKSLFSVADRTLSANAYLVDIGMPIDAAHFPDAAFRAAIAELCDTDANAVLDIREISAVTALDVSGRGIASLDGLHYLTALTTLNCSGNRLDALDLTQNAALAALVRLENRAITGVAKRFSSGGKSLTCNLGVRVITGSAVENPLTLPRALTDIDDGAFMGIAAEAVVVPDGCRRIGSMAFADCPNLSEITIPESVTEIADDAFANSPDVYILSPSADVRQWAARHGIGSAAE